MQLFDHLHIEGHPKLGTLDVPLLAGTRHLVLTGPNGSGKTLLLRAIADSLRSRPVVDNSGTHLVDSSGAIVFSVLSSVPSLEVSPTLAGARGAQAGVSWLPADRTFQAPRTNRPPDAANLEAEAEPGQFYHWLRHQHLQALLAKAADDLETSKRLTTWLQRFECVLGEAMDLPELKLVFDPKTYELNLREGDGPLFPLHDLSDGHSSILSIVSTILQALGSDALLDPTRNQPAVVIIDEPEKHLHMELQERLLGFLTTTFPCAQFVLATHSAAVAANTPEATVFDLERREGSHSAVFRGMDYADIAVAHFGIETPFDLATTRDLHALAKLVAAGDRSSSAYRTLLNALRDVDNGMVLDELLRQVTTP